MHPLLRCRTVEVKPGKFELVEEDSFDIDIEVFHGRTVQDVWHEYHTKPIELGKPASLTKLFVLHPDASEDTGDSFILIFVFNHAFADGISASRYVASFLSVLESGMSKVGPSLGFSQPYFALVKEKLRTLSRSTYFWAFRRFFGYALFGEECAYFPRDDVSITYKDIAARSYCSNLLGELSKGDTSLLLQQCKARQFTVGQATCAAFMLAMKRVLVENGDSSNISLAIVSSARREYLPGSLNDADFGFHVSGLRPLYSKLTKFQYDIPASGEDVWDYAVAVKKHMAKKVVNTHPITALAFIHVYFRDLAHKFKSYETIAVSNWGRMPIEDSYGKWTIERAYPVSSFNNMIMPTCLVSTAVGRLSINVGVGVPAVKLDAAQSLLDECLRLLRASLSVQQV